MFEASLLMTVLFCIPPTASPDSVPSARPQEAQGSARAIDFSLRVGSVHSGTARVVEGNALTISAKDGTRTALVPTLDDARLFVDVVVIRPDGNGGETRQSVGRLELTHGQWVDVASASVPLAIRWDGTSEQPRQANEVVYGPCTRCCVTCEDITICGCRIVLDCGSCCCSFTCICDDARAPVEIPDDRS